MDLLVKLSILDMHSLTAHLTLASRSAKLVNKVQCQHVATGASFKKLHRCHYGRPLHSNRASDKKHLLAPALQTLDERKFQDYVLALWAIFEWYQIFTLRS